MLLGEAPQLGLAGHAHLLLVDDLAEDARRVQARQAGEVDGGLGVAGALEHAALAGLEREDVAGAGQVAGAGGRVDERLHGGGPVERRDAGGRAVPVVDAHEERGAHALGVLLDHRPQVELGGALAGDRRADEARGVVEEERDLLGGDVLGRHDQVALVLAVLVVDHDEDLAAGERLERLVDVGEPPGRPSRRPLASASGSVVLAHGCVPFQEGLDVLGHDVELDVDRVARALVPERGDLGGVGDDGDGEAVVVDGGHGEAHAVDGDRALLHHVAEEVGGDGDAQVGRGVDDDADRVDVALDEVAAEPVAEPHRALEVDRVAGLQVAEGGAGEGLLDDVGLPPVGARARRR